LLSHDGVPLYPGATTPLIQVLAGVYFSPTRPERSCLPSFFFLEYWIIPLPTPVAFPLSPPSRPSLMVGLHTTPPCIGFLHRTSVEEPFRKVTCPFPNGPRGVYAWRFHSPFPNPPPSLFHSFASQNLFSFASLKNFCRPLPPRLFDVILRFCELPGLPEEYFPPPPFRPGSESCITQSCTFPFAFFFPENLTL